MTQRLRETAPHTIPGRNVTTTIIERVLADSGFRDNARRLADSIAAETDPLLAAGELESLA